MKLLKRSLAALSALALLAALFFGASAVPEARAQSVPVGAYCCDQYAARRCVLDFLAPVGSSCFCRGQGWGWACQ